MRSCFGNLGFQLSVSNEINPIVILHGLQAAKDLSEDDSCLADD
jgi:hypothetical protein